MANSTNFYEVELRKISKNWDSNSAIFLLFSSSFGNFWLLLQQVGSEKIGCVGRGDSVIIFNIEPGQQRIDIIELKRFAKLYGKETGYFLK